MKPWIPAAVAIGIVLLFIGMVAGVYADDEDAINTSTVIADLGILIGGIGFAVGALVDTEIDNYTRMGMIIAGALFMALLWM
ncbi:MAG: hypothetical protein U9O96_03860 [Candidatus Thermoplasmatota archaeon]|nr:hypothetical protein [Candidatus Thermoplasmatota archaeon]